MFEPIETIGSEHPYQLCLKIDGPKVRPARLSISDFTKIITTTQQAIKRIGQVLSGQDSATKGRKPREIEQSCELEIASWGDGSVNVSLELVPDQSELYGSIGQRSISAFLDGVNFIGQMDSLPDRFPEGFDIGVIQSLETIGRALGQGIDSVTYQSHNGRESQVVRFDAVVQTRVRSILTRPISTEGVTKVGRLEQISGHGMFTGKLYEAGGTSSTCIFKEDQADILADAWMHVVQVTGTAVMEFGKETRFIVDALVVVADDRTGQASLHGSESFWHSWTIDELAEAQAITPVTDLDAITALWPADDDPDEFIKFIQSDRSERRRVAGIGDKD
jgi:hypothetical protein